MVLSRAGQSPPPPSGAYGGYGPQPSPLYGPGYSAPPPTYSTYPPPPVYGGKSPVAPYCTTVTGCLIVNASSGGALDAFNLTAQNWVTASPSAMLGMGGLQYEFGVATPLGMSGEPGKTVEYRPGGAWRNLEEGVGTEGGCGD